MFKNASDLQSYQQRVASHATKEWPTGRIDAIPANAEQPVAYFNALYDQYKILAANYKLLTADAAMLRARLKQRMTHTEYHRTQGQFDAVGAQIQRIEEQFAELRPLIRAARSDAMHAFKWQMAKAILQQEDVRQIENQCALFAGTDLAITPALKHKSTGEREGDKHTHRAKANKQSLHRRRARSNLEFAKQEGLVMYASSDFKQQDGPQQYSVAPAELLQALADHFNKK